MRQAQLKLCSDLGAEQYWKEYFQVKARIETEDRLICGFSILWDMLEKRDPDCLTEEEFAIKEVIE